MQHSKTIYLLDETDSCCQRLATLLEFVGERPLMVSAQDMARVFTQQQKLPFCIIAGASVDAEKLIRQHRNVPFLITARQSSDALSHANALGQISDKVSYPELTQLLHYCQEYHRQRPKPRLNGANVTLHRLMQQLVGQSPAIDYVRTLISQVAGTQANVLILGESGTGKEVTARCIHELSARSEGPFVPVNCGAIPGDLLESELFGHEKGAFTGAINSRKGRFELAKGGTLFLDEIGDMPMSMQVKLLRVIQERVFERVGGQKVIQADVRIIAATHRKLDLMIQQGAFREDLYYRLNVFPIEVPALRQRQDDIPLLVHSLVQRLETEQGVKIKFTDAAVASLAEHSWPGNVRELANLIERMSITHPDGVVDVVDLPAKYRHIDAPQFIAEYPPEPDERDTLNALFADDDDDYLDDDMAEFTDTASAWSELPPDGVNLKELLSEMEVNLIRQALDQQDWVVARAAELLDMRRTTLVEKMRKHGLKRDS